MKVSFTLAAAAAVLVAVPAAAQSRQPRCELRAERSEIVRDCHVIVGYSEGKRVGAFRVADGFDRKEIGTTAACTLNERYHRELGRIIRPNKVALGKRTFTLSPDCLSSTVK